MACRTHLATGLAATRTAEIADAHVAISARRAGAPSATSAPADLARLAGSDPDIVVPDLAGWRRERMPEMPDVAYFTLAPDWACEVLSPSTEDVDRAEKVPLYAREGVSPLWLVDPLVRTLEVLRLDGGTYRLISTVRGEARVRAEPFDALELELALLWAR